MTVTVRPICYFDGRNAPMPPWLNQRQQAEGSVDVLMDEPPKATSDEAVGELVGPGENLRQVAAGRVLVVGTLLLKPV